MKLTVNLLSNILNFLNFNTCKFGLFKKKVIKLEVVGGKFKADSNNKYWR